MDRGVLEVTGGVPMGSDPLMRTAVRNVAVVNPTVFFVASVRQALVDFGIEVTGEAIDIDDIVPHAETLDGIRERRVLVTTQSPTLREIGTVLMKVSQNLYAETLVKAMGAARGGLGTTAGGRVRMEETLTAWGIPRDAYVIADGSGLSRYNYCSAAMITAILERMHTDPRHRYAFAETLPVAGKDGTIGRRMRRSRAEGNALAKTGSIANVRALSGYVETRDGETFVFSILANDFPIPAATVTWIVDLAVETLANFTRR
jgi:D-alanyl-D-alanine carboxypeptidase/D-alanyl-D-alanine-endopeptidase (penicillin-binding protein 4)